MSSHPKQGANRQERQQELGEEEGRGACSAAHRGGSKGGVDYSEPLHGPLHPGALKENGASNPTRSLGELVMKAGSMSDT